MSKAFTVTTKSGTYYLHKIENPRYYFAKSIGENAVEKKPVGFRVKKNTPAGLPFLVRT